jgi:hypothetical protein
MDSGYCLPAGPCEHSNKPLDTIAGKEFLISCVIIQFQRTLKHMVMQFTSQLVFFTMFKTLRSVQMTYHIMTMLKNQNFEHVYVSFVLHI